MHVCVCLCLSVCYRKIAVNFNYLKTKQATSHKLGNLRQSGSLQDRQVLAGKHGSSCVLILNQEKLTVQILHKRHLNQGKDTVLLET